MFSYKFSVAAIVLAYFTSVPTLAVVIARSTKTIFGMLMSFLLSMGAVPAVIAYSFSDDPSRWAFIGLYLLIIPILSLFSRPNIRIRSRLMPVLHVDIDSLLWSIGMVGFFFYLYLAVKYRNNLAFHGLETVYEQRSAFAAVVARWEEYAIAYSKSLSAFSFIVLSLRKNSWSLILPCIFIFVVDYLLAAHKASLAFAAFSIAYYYICRRKDRKFTVLYFALPVSALFSILIPVLAGISSILFQVVVSLYDRLFLVTGGLFARYYDFASNNYLFRGGSGVLGSILGGVKEPYMFVVGEKYFSAGVRANADLVSDGYINFGLVGSLAQIVILWILFGKRDNRLFMAKHQLLFPFMMLYMNDLFSMGLQTTLLTGGMFLFLIAIKGIRIDPA